MTFEEFEVAQNADLTLETKRCFDIYNNQNFASQARSAALLEAQFYMQELGRREDAKVARRDLILELIVIALIGLEIVLAVYGTRLAIKQANDQDVMMSKQMEVLNRLDGNMQLTAQTLQSSQTTMQSMDKRLGMELGRMARIDLMFSFSAGNAELYNRGNADLEYWGYKLANLPARMNKKPVPLRGGAKIEHLPRILDDIRNAKGPMGQLEIYVRDDLNNEYVGEGNLGVGPNIGGSYDVLQAVRRQWSHK